MLIGSFFNIVALAIGNAEFVPAMACAATAAGTDGLLLEIHPDPTKALCDGVQSIAVEQLGPLCEKIRKILGVLPDSYKNVDLNQLYILREKYPDIYVKVEERLDSFFVVQNRRANSGFVTIGSLQLLPFHLVSKLQTIACYMFLCHYQLLTSISVIFTKLLTLFVQPFCFPLAEFPFLLPKSPFFTVEFSIVFVFIVILPKNIGFKWKERQQNRFWTLH